MKLGLKENIPSKLFDPCNLLTNTNVRSNCVIQLGQYDVYHDECMVGRGYVVDKQVYPSNNG